MEKTVLEQFVPGDDTTRRDEMRARDGRKADKRERFNQHALQTSDPQLMMNFAWHDHRP